VSQIHTSLVVGRPGANESSAELLEFTLARFVRLRLQKIRTLKAEFMSSPGFDDASVTRRLFYSIKDISIGGQCVCSGHASKCPQNGKFGVSRGCFHITLKDITQLSDALRDKEAATVIIAVSVSISECIQKFPYWPPGARTANGTALCHWLQLDRYFDSQSNEFCRHDPLCCFSTSVYCCKPVFRYDSVRKLLDTPLVYQAPLHKKILTKLGIKSSPTLEGECEVPVHLLLL